ncbi:hypothetical protein TIFTF001_015332 [Ficus carica]|uniref:Ubiquitin-like protease family profile domain-containing protein n=1 Tax=Ficus carica TaxID=3494 RepID=A0AA88A700_FICCA|nr:hypothetical protein TIFTF001_015332 [Ficus carica]
MIALTVDQHNNFKASCTLNEKDAGMSNPQPMPNAIPGIPLGEENVRVTITVPKLKRALLPILTNEATCIEEVVGGHAPDREAEGSKRIKKRAGKKKIQSQPEVQQQTSQQELPPFNFSEIPFELRPLAYYTQSSLRDGTQIACPTQQSVNGDDMPIYIGFEDVYHFVTFQEISANSIMVYISYLADCYARAGVDQSFKFISPVLVSPVQQNVDCEIYCRERANNILRILTNTPRGKLFLMPYNSGQHWILAVIDPWDDSVLYFNPLGNEPGDDFKSLIKLALNDWKIMVGRGVRKQQNYKTLIDTVRCPIQEGYVECGYFVLAFMREITLTVDGLTLLQTNDFYTDADMSLISYYFILGCVIMDNTQDLHRWEME